MAITPYRNRTLDTEVPVEVYRNIRRGDYSVRQKGYVVGRADKVVLRDATFVVQEAGRKEVLRTGRKNVHAWVKGLVNQAYFTVRGRLRSARYSPKKTKTFVDLDNGQPVHTASFVILAPTGVLYG